MRAWRFYDHFRTDATAPARLPQIGTHTPVLSHDGADLAAALQTIREIGDGPAVDEAIEDAFPGARVLNEPETSLHPDLLPALGRLIAQASQRSQVLVVSHAPALIDALQSLPECHSLTLEKKMGQTTLAGEDNEHAPWQWPAR